MRGAWPAREDMAERGGFEPPVQLLTVQRFSKPPPSATRPSLRVLSGIIPEVAVTPRKGSKETHRTHRLSPVSFPFLEGARVVRFACNALGLPSSPPQDALSAADCRHLLHGVGRSLWHRGHSWRSGVCQGHLDSPGAAVYL